jgi:SAM-dependent methyltransferase/glycosyltransferase involved in cell wall biosynthesis
VNIDSENESQLPWTGERYIPQITGEIQLEHIHRYLLAREYAEDKEVLDIACGEGFGSAILAKSARSVVGVDISTEVINHAAIRYRLDNVEFRQSSCAAIPLNDHSIDLVVSFETIEHHDEHLAMMAEIKRVLRPEGVLIISSPDKNEYSIKPNYHNPFHARELFKEEFEGLIRAYFKNLDFLAQRIVYGSGILPEKGVFRITDYDIKDTTSGSSRLARPRYLIAMASDEALPVLSGGLLEQSITESEIVKRYADEYEKRSEYITQLEQQLLSESSEPSVPAETVRSLEERVGALDLALLEARGLYHSTTHSLSWRLTWPLRAIRDVAAATLNRVQRGERAPVARSSESSGSPLQIKSSTPKPKLDPLTARFVDLIRISPLFDGIAYEGAAEARSQSMDPAVHYVLVGEARGFKPSPGFDPAYYSERYPDVAAWGGNRLGHYLEWGRAQGRRVLPLAETLTFPVDGIKSGKPTILLLVHEASRTGAPILGWNIVCGLRGQANLVAILFKEGPIEISFGEVAAAIVGPIGNDIFDPVELVMLARRLVRIYRPIYVIANSTETRALVPALSDEGVPSVALVHEFSATVKPAGILRLLYERAEEVVFPADIVRRSSEIDYPFLKLRHTHLLPQGPSVVPRSSAPIDDPERTELERAIRSQLRPEDAEDDLVVVGMGTVAWRKGVDLFIATATAVLAREPRPQVRFVWVGDGYGSPLAAEVSSYLSEQIIRSGLGNRFEIMEAVDDVESIYKETDVLFLSSRLDPLPNVSIDAVLRGIPVVCFAEASGMAEILVSHDETRELVVPHLDVGAAAALISSLATDGKKLSRLGDAVREVAQARFDMDAYVAALHELGTRARQSAEREVADAALILKAGAFDAPLYLGERAPLVEVAVAVREYSALAHRYNYARSAKVHQACTRRPLAGFHPITYALKNPNYEARTGGDPLAHYLKTGRPEGRWTHPVLRIEGPEDIGALPKQNVEELRVLLHGHFHYTDHVGDLLRALAANEQHCDLILTTNSTDKAAEIAAVLDQNQMKADIRVVPNRGRDIGPFLPVLQEAQGRYDLLGHIHGKRSPHVDKEVGDRWRVFLWQHLIGDEIPMVDMIKQMFVADNALGLVFPEDPYLVGWDKNLELAEEMAVRMKLRAPLPATIESPVGTMFWTRPEALTPLLRLGLNLEDFPDEPVPIDGTMLHALERLLVPVAEDAGYRYKTTYLSRFVR